MPVRKAANNDEFGIEPTPLEKRSRDRLAELIANREKFIADAQRQLAALDGAIAEIQALLDPPAVSENGVENEIAGTLVLAE